MKYQIMPPLSTEEKEALRASIEMEGIRDPIIVDEEGNILDGYTRYEIASDAPRKVIKGLTEGEKLAFALRSNLGRRNLSLAQKKDLLKKQKEIARQLREENPTKNTQERVAALLGVARNTISDWLRIKDTSNVEADNTCTPTISASYRRPDARIKIPPKEKPVILELAETGMIQEQIAADYGVTQQQISSIVTRERKKKEAVKEREEAASKIKTDYGIHHGDFREKGNIIPDNSVDLIFTDPPYDKESASLYGDLAEFAARVLRPGGWCLAYSGQSWLPQVLNAMAAHLSYGWIFAIHHTGSDLRFRKYKIQNKWKPIVGFYRPPLNAWWDWFPDLATGRKEKEIHKWQQSLKEAEHYIKALSPNGGLICDPFAGSGTTCLAAKNMGMNWVAFEIDENYVKSARSRLID